jgi:glutamine cyclotransferase
MNFLTLFFANSKLLTGISIFFAFLFSCNPVPNKPSAHENGGFVQHKDFSLKLPENDYVTYINKDIPFEIKSLHKDVFPDSVEIYLEGKKVLTNIGSGLTFTGTSILTKTGRQNMRFKIFYADSLIQVLNSRMTVLSDIEPTEFKYKILRTLPHDPTSYVQGLIYNKGIIYEGSGQYSKSKLKKIDPKNGETLFEIKLDNEFFGEGITLLNKKIYQLTYQSKVGFIYDVESFELIRKFDLQTVEGWGLTNDTKNLISSDGSAVLYFNDPEYLTQVGQMDVCDHKGLVNNLNELEYVNGFIWSNVYGQKYLIKIDASNGKVVGKLNLENIFPKNLPDDIDHVLNGIAWNPDKKTFYITGKLWPVMYEAEILE